MVVTVEDDESEKLHELRRLINTAPGTIFMGSDFFVLECTTNGTEAIRQLAEEDADD